MAVIKRFTSIMSCNINSLKNKVKGSKKPLDEINNYIRQMESEVSKVMAEANAVFEAEKRARRALNEVEEEMLKMQRYAEKSLTSGNEVDARMFIQKKQDLNPKYANLKEIHEHAANNATKIGKMNDKLKSDIRELINQKGELKENIKSNNIEGLDSNSRLEKEIYERKALEELNNLSEDKEDDSIFDCLYEDDNTLEDSKDEIAPSKVNTINMQKTELDDEIADMKARMGI